VPPRSGGGSGFRVASRTNHAGGVCIPTPVYSYGPVVTERGTITYTSCCRCGNSRFAPVLCPAKLGTCRECRASDLEHSPYRVSYVQYIRKPPGWHLGHLDVHVALASNLDLDRGYALMGRYRPMHAILNADLGSCSPRTITTFVFCSAYRRAPRSR
jgi:hypothetical protein